MKLPSGICLRSYPCKCLLISYKKEQAKTLVLADDVSLPLVFVQVESYSLGERSHRFRSQAGQIATLLLQISRDDDAAALLISLHTWLTIT